MTALRSHPEANLRRLMDLLEVGDLAGVDRHLARYEGFAATQPEYRRHAATLQAMRALLAGRLGDAETLVAQAFDLARQAQAPDAALVHVLQLFALRRDQGRLEEVEPTLRAVYERHPANRSLQTGLTLLLGETGRDDEARRRLDRLAANAFAAIPRDAHDVNALDQAARACHALGDAHRARQLYERLSPYASRNVVAGLAYACGGPVAGTLGLLAVTLHRFDDAAAHFDAALAMCRRLGAPACTAHVERAYGAMLLARGNAGEATRAAALLDDAVAVYAALGMDAHVVRTQALRPRSVRPGDRGPVFQRSGSSWRVTFDGREARVADGDAVRHLAVLVQQPGRALHVVDLAGPAHTDETGAPLSPAVRARLARRQRLAELRLDLEAAARAGDGGRAAALQADLDTVVAELAMACGLAARDASTLDHLTRTVTAAIRDAIAALGREHPSLGRHLRAAVRLGTFCVYGHDGNDAGTRADARARWAGGVPGGAGDNP